MFKFINKIIILIAVDQHYTGNKSRNAIIREDLPKAKDEQKREEEEALAKYQQMVILQ